MKKFFATIALLTAGTMLGITMVSAANQVGIFKDTTNHYAKDAIKYVTEKGIMVGYPDGTFKPDNVITRAELAIILQRLYTNGNNETPKPEPKPEVPKPELTWEQVEKQSKPAIVYLQGEYGDTGTGFIIKENYILTAAHVYGDADRVVPMYARPYNKFSSKSKVQLVAIHPKADLAILKVVDNGDFEKNTNKLSISNKIKLLNDEVITIGNPGADKFVVTKGKITQVVRNNIDYEFVSNIKVNYGNSGGPVIDKSGQAIGVVARFGTDCINLTNIDIKQWIDKNIQ